jgi:DNA-binding response OmpR family regulator
VGSVAVRLMRLIVKILVVEDDLPIADLLCEALKSAGHDVFGVARTAHEAMEEAGRNRPDYAIVDIRLADGSLGTEFVTRWREVHNVRVVFSTGSDDVSQLADFAGDAVMTKPYLIRDVICGLKIVDEVAKYGMTKIKFPLNFRLIEDHCQLTELQEGTVIPATQKREREHAISRRMAGGR